MVPLQRWVDVCYGSFFAVWVALQLLEQESMLLWSDLFSTSSWRHDNDDDAIELFTPLSVWYHVLTMHVHDRESEDMMKKKKSESE